MRSSCRTGLASTAIPAGPIQRLHLALLIQAQHDRLMRRIQIQPYHIRQLSRNFGSREEFEVLLRVR